MLALTDMSKVAAIDELIERTVASLGRIDVLVNNAGVTKSLGFFDVTEADWDWMHSINARGLFFCMQRAAREMVKQKSGKIVNIASIAGKGFRGTSNIAYAGTKGAVIAMTRIAASQLARAQYQRECDLPGRHPHPHVRIDHERTGRETRRQRGRGDAAAGCDDSAGPIEFAGRYRQHGGVSGFSRGREYNRANRSTLTAA